MLDLKEILKYAPEGLRLYSSYHKRPVTFKTVYEGKFYGIICDVTDYYKAGNEITFNSSGEYYKDAGIVLWPEKGKDWNQWQLSILPKCIGSIIINNNYDLYKILPNSTIVEYGMDNTTDVLPISSIDLLEFRFASPNEIELYYNKPIEKSHFKAFDKVLVRNKGGMWHCMLFSHQKNNHYFACGKYWDECIPYNKYTEYLIGISEDFDMNTIRKNKK